MKIFFNFVNCNFCIEIFEKVGTFFVLKSAHWRIFMKNDGSEPKFGVKIASDTKFHQKNFFVNLTSFPAYIQKFLLMFQNSWDFKKSLNGGYRPNEVGQLQKKFFTERPLRGLNSC